MTFKIASLRHCWLPSLTTRSVSTGRMKSSKMSLATSQLSKIQISNPKPDCPRSPQKWLNEGAKDPKEWNHRMNPAKIQTTKKLKINCHVFSKTARGKPMALKNSTKKKKIRTALTWSKNTPCTESTGLKEDYMPDPCQAGLPVQNSKRFGTS